MHERGFAAKQVNPHSQAGSQLDPVEFLALAAQLWIRKRNKALPEPCPRSPHDTATWWLGQMQPPDIDPVLARSALLAFLDLDKAGRIFVVAARQDGVTYRGDDLDTFRAVYEESMKARKNPERYKRETTKALQGYLRRVRATR